MKEFGTLILTKVVAHQSIVRQTDWSEPLL